MCQHTLVHTDTHTSHTANGLRTKHLLGNAYIFICEHKKQSCKLMPS